MQWFFFKKKKGSGTHSDTKFGQGGERVVIPMPGKKVLECRSSMHPSERKLLGCKCCKTIK
jgi:hypothetical protein